MNLTTLVSALRSGELPLVEYIANLEEKFSKLDAKIHAFVPEAGRFDRIRRAAVRLLRDYPDPQNRPPLFGVPVGVKDIFHVDGLPTRGGSRLPADVVRGWANGVEAQSVTLLKQAGALILGKCVTTEFAYFSPGATRNPHNLAHTPGGSSSGSAAAVGGGICPLTLGTQTIGSIVRPAAYCGVVGYKPSYDRISRAGVIPLSPFLDHIGPLASDVAGVALVASVLVNYWRPELQVSQKPHLGIPVGAYLQNASSRALAQFESVVERLQAAGFAVTRVEVMSDFAEIYDRHQRIVAAEAAQTHAGWFSAWSELYQPKTQELVRRGQTIPAAQLTQDYRGRASLQAALHQAMGSHAIDLWISPAAPDIAPVGLESTGNPVMSLPFSHAGLPSLGIPSGWDSASRLPFGLQMVAKFGADEELLVWGAMLEKALAIG